MRGRHVRPVPPRPLPSRRPAGLQVKDLNSGTFGFVQLARDRSTGELVAIKFIERGEKVRPLPAPPDPRGPSRSALEI
jgi:hypothetical protein